MFFGIWWGRTATIFQPYTYLNFERSEKSILY